MNIIGLKQLVSVPKVRLLIDGEEKIPATHFTCNYAAGQIAVAKCGILPQFLKNVPPPGENNKVQINIKDLRGSGQEMTLFTGYISGIYGNRNGVSYTAGIDLIHAARDLDNMRFGAPGLHPGGANDFRYKRMLGSGTSASASSGIWSAGASYYNGKKSIPEEVIAEIVKRLGIIGSTEKHGVGIPFKKESLKPCIDLLNSIKVKCSAPLEITKPLIVAINDSFVGKCENSFNIQSSIWDLLTVLFGELGILFCCMPDGSVICTPDVSGIEAPKENFLDGDVIVNFDHSSRSYRNIGGVDIICSQAALSSSKSAMTEANALVASYYPETKSGSGSSFVLNAPKFMYPLSQYQGGGEKEAEAVPPTAGNPKGSGVGGGKIPEFKKFRDAYAKMMYFMERNKTSTFTCVTPVMPGVFPGTTAQIQPYSSGRVRPEESGELGDKTIFNGFCYGVSHSIDFKAKSMSTTMQFRNVAPINEVLSKEHPLYEKWVPLKWT